MIKKFDEFVNEMFSSRPYGEYNIMSDAIDEFVKKYYNTDRDKLHGQQYIDFLKKHPELDEFINFIEDNEDDFTIGVYYYSEKDERDNIYFYIDEIDNDDCERCIKTIKTYSDKNMVDKMLRIIDDVIDNKIDIDDVVQWATDYMDSHNPY
jgi:hypothetical protein